MVIGELERQRKQNIVTPKVHATVDVTANLVEIRRLKTRGCLYGTQILC